MSMLNLLVERFLLKFSPLKSPLLLAFSGGADSTALFYALLFYREKYEVPFHVAHVDHRWRDESVEEASVLKSLAVDHQVPFHLKTLDPCVLKGNLEAACREERYTFFAELMKKIPFQALLTGHHQDDLAETVFKRLLEGAHWSNWHGILEESEIKGMRVLRPLLEIGKSEIQQTLAEQHISFFEDPSNYNLKFLRASFREAIFPRLNQEFGKRVQKSLAFISQESEELTDYFNDRIAPYQKEVVRGPFGIFLDLQQTIPEILLEIKYLLRAHSHQQHFFLSREIIAQGALALQKGEANRLFIMGERYLQIDRQRLFILNRDIHPRPSGRERLSLILGENRFGRWLIQVTEEELAIPQKTGWKECWKGKLLINLPPGDYTIEDNIEKIGDPIIQKIVKKRWSQAKVPHFLYSYFPLILQNGNIAHEFLTGNLIRLIEPKEHYWRVSISLEFSDQ